MCRKKTWWEEVSKILLSNKVSCLLQEIIVRGVCDWCMDIDKDDNKKNIEKTQGTFVSQKILLSVAVLQKFLTQNYVVKDIDDEEYWVTNSAADLYDQCDRLLNILKIP